MESAGHVTVPLRAGGKKMRKRRELDALVAHSLAKRACNSGKRNIAGNGVTSQDQLLSQSTDEQEDYTWPKVRNTSRCRTKRISCLRTCGPLMLILCVFLSFGFMYWLYFDLRQQITEYRMRIEQVSATSQNVPEALQKWHETSKNLEQNQTILHNNIIEIHQILRNISTEIFQLKENVEKNINGNTKVNQLNVLQTNVAEFGAKIRVFTNDIENFKEHFNQLQTESKTTINDIIKLNKTIDNTLNHTIYSSNINNLTTEYIINNISNILQEQLLNLNKNLTSINYTLSQRTKGLEDDFIGHKVKLDKLSENLANISSIVTSVEQDWTSKKPLVTTFDETSKNMSAKITKLTNTTNYLELIMNKVQIECQSYHDKNDNIFKEIDLIKSKLTGENYNNNNNNNNNNNVVSKIKLTTISPIPTPLDIPTTKKTIEINNNDNLNKNDKNNTKTLNTNVNNNNLINNTNNNINNNNNNTNNDGTTTLMNTTTISTLLEKTTRQTATSKNIFIEMDKN